MKRIIPCLLSLLLVFSLFSCGGNNGGGDNNNTPSEGNGIGSIPYTTIINGETTLNLNDLVTSISDACGKLLAVRNDTSEHKDGEEIVFGSTGRAVTLEAKAVIDALLEEQSQESLGYIIYKSSSGSVAVYWSHGYLAEEALASFSSTWCDLSELAEKRSGIITQKFYGLDAYIEAHRWEDIESSASPEVLAALKKLNTYYDGPAIADWMAYLYDPFICTCKNCDPESGELACYGGAFYFSNSARDYSGFLPDAESTVQLLRWMENNGAFENYADYAEALPQSVKDNLIKFAQSLQDESDGYFYHPQWGKNIQTDRKGRDLGWATGILSTLGGKPLYPTATERLEGKATSAHLTGHFGVGTASAVSSVLPTATALEEALKSEDTYMEWLVSVTKGDDMFESSSGAHTINASISQIKAAGYQKITLDYLDAQQDKLFNEMKAAYDADPVNNPRPTGLWQRTADYNAVWGLLKFAALYNREIRYAEYGILTCIDVIKLPAEGDSYYMNDVYNQWQGAINLISNAKKYRSDIVPTLYEYLRADAPAMIENSINKVKKFKCDDGGFSYRIDMAPPKMYGAPTALGVKESDVNATSLASSMYRAIFSALGYDDVPLCDFRDGERFIDIISSAQPIDKIMRASAEPYTFDEKPSSMAENFNGGYAEIVTDPQKPDNNVIKYVSEPDDSSGDSLVFEVYEETVGANCFVFELDMMVESGNQQMLYQFRIANSGNKNAYMFVILLQDGKIKIADNPTTSNTTNMKLLGAEAELGEWFHLRFEYYTDPTMPTVKFYFNGELTAVSHNYFGCDKGSAPVNTYTEARLMALKKTDAVSYIDNAFFGKITKDYVDETPKE